MGPLWRISSLVAGMGIEDSVCYHGIRCPRSSPCDQGVDGETVTVNHGWRVGDVSCDRWRECHVIMGWNGEDSFRLLWDR